MRVRSGVGSWSWLFLGRDEVGTRKGFFSLFDNGVMLTLKGNVQKSVGQSRTKQVSIWK